MEEVKPEKCIACGKNTFLGDFCYEHQEPIITEPEYPRVNPARIQDEIFIPREGEDYCIGYEYDIVLEADAHASVIALDSGMAKERAMEIPRRDLDWDRNVVMCDVGRCVRMTMDDEPEAFDEDAWRAKKVAEAKAAREQVPPGQKKLEVEA